MSRRLIAVTAAIVLVAAAGDGMAKKPSKACLALGEGVGYYAYFHQHIPMFEPLNTKAAAKVNEWLNLAAKTVIEDDFGKTADLSSPDFMLSEKDAVKPKVGGLSVNFTKKISEAASKAGLGYVLEVYFYTAAQGSNMNAQPGGQDFKRTDLIDLKDPDGALTVFEFIYFEVSLVSSDKDRTVDKTPEKQYSYKNWFREKYQSKGNPPPGVSYESSAQYKLFIKESLADAVNSMRAYKKLAECKEEGK